jgi:hypothetical protein
MNKPVGDRDHEARHGFIWGIYTFTYCVYVQLRYHWGMTFMLYILAWCGLSLSYIPCLSKIFHYDRNPDFRKPSFWEKPFPQFHIIMKTEPAKQPFMIYATAAPSMLENNSLHNFTQNWAKQSTVAPSIVDLYISNHENRAEIYISSQEWQSRFDSTHFFYLAV